MSYTVMQIFSLIILMCYLSEQKLVFLIKLVKSEKYEGSKNYFP